MKPGNTQEGYSKLQNLPRKGLTEGEEGREQKSRNKPQRFVDQTLVYLLETPRLSFTTFRPMIIGLKIETRPIVQHQCGSTFLVVFLTCESPFLPLIVVCYSFSSIANHLERYHLLLLFLLPWHLFTSYSPESGFCSHPTEMLQLMSLVIF